MPIRWGGANPCSLFELKNSKNESIANQRRVKVQSALKISNLKVSLNERIIADQRIIAEQYCSPSIPGTISYHYHILLEGSRTKAGRRSLTLLLCLINMNNMIRYDNKESLARSYQKGQGRVRVHMMYLASDQT